MSIHNATRKGRLGEAGEDAAAAYLEARGYVIVERNWHIREGELDLIARDGETLCIVEVRAKTRPGLGHPVETVTGPKQRRIVRMAEAYLQQKGLDDVAVRFDVIGLVPVANGPFRITHIKNAFEAY